MNKKILIIIPAFNEEKNILTTYQHICDTGEDFDCLVINDGSTDQTAAICHEHNIPCINLSMNLGIGGAVQTGYKYALKHHYDIAVQCDGDGQHKAEYIKDLIYPILSQQCDFTVGSRFIEKKGYQSKLMRRLGIRLISLYLRLLIDSHILDVTSGFRACNQEVMRVFVNHYPSEYPEPSSYVILKKFDFKIKEVAVEMNERGYGVSTISSFKSIYYMLNVMILMTLLCFTRFDKV